MWFGSRCKGSAQGSQTNIQKYNYLSNSYVLIPTRIHRAQIVGVIPAATLNQIGPEFSSGDTQISNGVIISTKMSTIIGSDLNVTGYGLSAHIPDLSAYNVVGQSPAFINSVNASVDFPNPGTITVSYDFILNP